ncbi:uncharacterized protein LOC132295951 [Cornus florida]|uniref:uncharacterized protein LOC132295951 n=1 Tax=Cornus florida TaxID=4283 RepID=UPI00289A49FA|nr:uncharacterized protein LOC132295951 [Cornus florida]
MKAYKEAVKSATRGFDQIEFHQVPRENNSEVDRLAATASSSDEDLIRIVPIDTLEEPRLGPQLPVMVIPAIPREPSWMDPLESYLKNGILPDQKDEARKVRNAEEYARRCDKCQRYGPMKHQPAEDLYTMVEAKAYSSVTYKQVKSFLWNNIICRFGVSKVIMMDNEKNFDNMGTRKFFAEHGIRQKLAAVSHPQGNGQAKITNRTSFNCLKKKLEKLKSKWCENRPSMLWAYRTTPRRPTGESPFAMTYGSEAVIPTESAIPTLRTHQLRNNYNKRIRFRSFVVGDWVLKQETAHVKKLQPNWIGPYRVMEVVGKGVYRLAEANGRVIARPWNAIHLKRYYH